MLKHSVYIAAHDSDALAKVSDAMTLIEGLQAELPGMLDLAHGPNLDFEQKSQTYSYGFIITFTDRAAHLEYETHLDHQAAGALLVAAATGGHDGIFVADLDVSAQL
ncbi:Dabb family protein [Fontisubflavum oceani]|uniref:Dabb family protein n=1 Tax=Fontisubflavum oceani TaxID=2978973 RepID=UPI0025B3C528|nr:Dabb family protein [Fontisubflavum oceani]WJY21277.1 Dabb family protein [Fontisubflavum oceani]